MPIIVTVKQEIRWRIRRRGYFYALDSSAERQQIRDALQIYNVAKLFHTAIFSRIIPTSYDTKHLAHRINIEDVLFLPLFNPSVLHSV